MKAESIGNLTPLLAACLGAMSSEVTSSTTSSFAFSGGVIFKVAEEGAVGNAATVCSEGSLFCKAKEGDAHQTEGAEGSNSLVLRAEMLLEGPLDALRMETGGGDAGGSA